MMLSVIFVDMQKLTLILHYYSLNHWRRVGVLPLHLGQRKELRLRPRTPKAIFLHLCEKVSSKSPPELRYYNFSVGLHIFLSLSEICILFEFFKFFARVRGYRPITPC